jgi:hypothetical protein
MEDLPRLKAGEEVSTLGALARVARLSRVRCARADGGESSPGRVRQVVPPILGVGLAQPQRNSHDWLGAPRSFRSRRDRLYPVLPLRDIVVFPHMIVPLFVGREKSIRALEEVVKTDG